MHTWDTRKQQRRQRFVLFHYFLHAHAWIRPQLVLQLTGHTYMRYYIVDGIYPNWLYFLNGVPPYWAPDKALLHHTRSLLENCRRFETGGVPGPTSECRRVPQPRWVEREGEREGGRARRPETGVREVGIPQPSCSSRAQVGCACSRGLQASTRERERAASSERLSRPRPRAAHPL
jgi:hypothetical protein